MAVAPSRSLNGAVEHASTILATDPASARAEAEAILKNAPRDPRALLILASAHRRLGDHADALSILRPLARAFPRAAHTHYELGAALAAQGSAAEAIAALRHSVSLRRDLAEAWRALGKLLFAAGDNAGADAAFAGLARARILLVDPSLEAAANAFHAGRLAEAEAALKAKILAEPNNATALHLMADVYMGLERHADAETLLAHALTLEPGHPGARFALANALIRQQKVAEALTQIEALLELDPEEPAYRNLQAGRLDLLGDFEQAIAIYDSLLAEFPKQPRFWLNRGHALRALGRRQEAIEGYRRALDLAPGLGDAYWSLANLKTAVVTVEDEAAMQRQLQRADLAPDDRLHLHYALGKALEDRDQHAGAFDHYATGAALRRLTLPYDSNAQTALVRRSMDLFTPAFFGARAGRGSPARDPIFIVGLPRSGSTLIEQILASHSAVEGTMELSDISVLARQVAGPGAAAYPACLSGLDADALRDLGESYLQRTRIQRKLGRPFFIDKTPSNFQHIGLIQMILPAAQIIDARRHPLGACFSAFKQHFAHGQAFTYDLADLGRYYRDYVALMAHFDEILPGRVHRVIYEDMVENTEIEVRRLLDYCGLPFEQACLTFHENDRAVRTISSEQVRQPIFRQGLEQWRHFEAWLDPLKAALGPALQGWRAPHGDDALETGHP
jgi:tetratricopeptide (TPR) repeat protein